MGAAVQYCKTLEEKKGFIALFRVRPEEMFRTLNADEFNQDSCTSGLWKDVYENYTSQKNIC